MSKINTEKSLSDNLLRGAKTRIAKINSSPFRKFNIGWLKEKYYKHAKKGSRYTHVYDSKISVSFTDPQAFLLSVRELFVEEIYKFRTDNPAPFILDCGAHIGMSVLFFKMFYPQSNIVAFEPDEHNFDLLKTNLAKWEFDNVELIKKAVWLEDGIISFNEAGDMGSSIVENVGESSLQIKSIPSIQLKKWLTKKVDFLKLDIEGAEYAVIKDCGDSLQNVQNMFLEYHGNYDQMEQLNTLLDIVVKQGFVYYIKEAGSIYARPFFDTETEHAYDVQLNIFCFRK